LERVVLFKTSDGQLHENYLKAERHAEERYGAAVCDLARKALQQDKYKNMVKFIEEHLDQFVSLKALQNDITLPPPEDHE